MLVAHRYAGKMMSSVKSKIPLILQFPGNTFRAYIQTVNCPVGNRKKGFHPFICIKCLVDIPLALFLRHEGRSSSKRRCPYEQLWLICFLVNALKRLPKEFKWDPVVHLRKCFSGAGLVGIYERQYEWSCIWDDIFLCQADDPRGKCFILIRLDDTWYSDYLEHLLRLLSTIRYEHLYYILFCLNAQYIIFYNVFF